MAEARHSTAPPTPCRSPRATARRLRSRMRTRSRKSIVTPTFTADRAGSYVLQLICNDTKVDSAPSTVTITVTSSGTISLALTSPQVGVSRPINGTITLSQQAPVGGVSVTLTSANSALATVAPSPVAITVGNTTGSFTVTGVAPGGPITLTG